ncbi:MAG: helix-turn-helix domain-containing protein [Bacillota bacterium]
MEATKVSDVEWLKPSELARRWNMSQRTIQRWIRTGKLPAMKRLGNPRVHISIIERHEQEGFGDPQPQNAIEPTPTRKRKLEPVPDRVGEILAARGHELLRRGADQRKPSPCKRPY